MQQSIVRGGLLLPGSGQSSFVRRATATSRKVYEIRMGIRIPKPLAGLFICKFCAVSTLYLNVDVKCFACFLLFVIYVFQVYIVQFKQ